MEKKLKVGLAGVGGISGSHIPAWLSMEDVILTAICDMRPEQLAAYPDIPHYTDFDEMLEKEEFDIIDICLPTFLHAEFAVKALKKGINVMTEKPLSLNEEDVYTVYNTAKANGVKFMVAHCLRFWPAYEYIKKLYDSKKYGALLSAHLWRLGVYPAWSYENWMMDEKKSGFIPYDLHIHDLDFLFYAFGAPKDHSVMRIKKPEQDYLSAVYTYEDFFITAEASWYKAQYPFQAGFRFQFENALVEYAHSVLTVYDAEGNVLTPLCEQSAAAELSAGSSGTLLGLPGTNAYANEIRYFADCVRYDRPVDKMKPEELYQVIQILNSFPK